jgi:putative Mg2+ transporter-C (MgtC) family protein
VFTDAGTFGALSPADRPARSRTPPYAIIEAVWTTIAATLRAEFADLSDPTQLTRLIVRLFVAVVLAACVGYEREIRGKTAGLRTHMLVALGVALIIIASQQAGITPADMSRVLQGIFAGIGFLGAGAILKHSDQERVTGLTTAASIWATAAIATAAGLGREATAVVATLFTVAILSVLLRLEPQSDSPHQTQRNTRGVPMNPPAVPKA